MRKFAAMLVVLCTLSCKSNGPTATDNRVAPPLLSVSATSRARAVAGSASELEVSALLRNGTSTQIRVSVGAAELSSYLPGMYGINVVVTTNPGLIGVWAGAIVLPLASAH